MPIRLLGEDATDFPATAAALTEPNGLVAIGGDLSVARLVNAYQRGIFPWFEDSQPILWWTPDPRLVLVPGQEHCSRSLAKFIRQSSWDVRIDVDFDAVVGGCAAPRLDASGTWITDSMRSAYRNLHNAGYAHSIGVFDGHQLIGGLYGVALGRVFFGESMFSRVSNASKVALILLSRWLAREQYPLIDCQVSNPHLLRLGAKEIPRLQFERVLSSCTSNQSIEAGQSLWHNARGKSISQNGHLIT